VGDEDEYVEYGGGVWVWGVGGLSGDGQVSGGAEVVVVSRMHILARAWLLLDQHRSQLLYSFPCVQCKKPMEGITCATSLHRIVVPSS